MHSPSCAHHLVYIHHPVHTHHTWCTLTILCTPPSVHSPHLVYALHILCTLTTPCVHSPHLVYALHTLCTLTTPCVHSPSLSYSRNASLSSFCMTSLSSSSKKCMATRQNESKFSFPISAKRRTVFVWGSVWAWSQVKRNVPAFPQCLTVAASVWLVCKDWLL
jgi:hypothetical protein